MLLDEGGKRARTVPHRLQFETQLIQLELLSLSETGERQTYFDSIKEGFYDLMDSTDWINSSHIWDDALHQVVFDCLAGGHDSQQWDASRMFFGLLLRHVIAHTGEEQIWEIIPKANKRGRNLIDDPEGSLYHCEARTGKISGASLNQHQKSFMRTNHTDLSDRA
jgi:hypothetical protein